MKSLALLLILSVTIAVSSREQTTNNGGSDAFTIFISPSTDTVKSGEPVFVKVRLTNISGHTIRVQRTMSQRMDITYQYDVKGPDGAEKRGDQTPKHVENDLDGSLQPGESTGNEEILLSKVYKMTEPGQYSIQLSRRDWDHDGKNPIVRSNTITITVAPKE